LFSSNEIGAQDSGKGRPANIDESKSRNDGQGKCGHNLAELLLRAFASG
jgi:hypothetical protein